MCSCSGITCCLALLGVYCDPHLRIYSWYSNKQMPFNNSIKDKPFHLAEHFIDDRYENMTLRNYMNVSKAWQRIGSANDTLSELLWSSKLGQNITDAGENEDTVIFAPVILLSTVLFLYNIGLGSVPYVLISELFSINVSIYYIKLKWTYNTIILF